MKDEDCNYGWRKEGKVVEQTKQTDYLPKVAHDWRERRKVAPL